MKLRNSIEAARVAGPSPQPDGITSFEFLFPENDPTFAGHFPGRPLLPGIFQLEMTRAAAQWVLDCSLDVSEISRAKFLRPILPAERVRLELKLTTAEDGIRARARFSVNGQPAGETTLRLCPHA